MPKALLGFDARVVGKCLDGLWSEERRQSYLLREVRFPLSVDELVWPAVFDEYPGVPSAWPHHLGWIPRPRWIGANDLWESLPAMEQALSAVPSVPPENQVWKVAISWHGRNELRAGPHGPYAEPTTPATAPASWEFLGYDIADPSISGLMNCGYEAGEREKLAGRWPTRLNEHHLLSQLDDAEDFLEITNQRVPEHAPFFVLGLWRIP